MDKRLIMLGMIIGSFLGGWIPTLFGVDAFSWISILGNFVGGILGILVMLRIASNG